MLHSCLIITPLSSALATKNACDRWSKENASLPKDGLHTSTSGCNLSAYYRLTLRLDLKLAFHSHRGFIYLRLLGETMWYHLSRPHRLATRREILDPCPVTKSQFEIMSPLHTDGRS